MSERTQHALMNRLEMVSEATGVVGGWLILPLILAMVYEVISRHFFGLATLWAFEVAYMLSGTCYLFGMAYCMKQDAHVRVDFLYDRFGKKGRAITNLAAYTSLVLPIVIWLTYALFLYALKAYERGEVSGVSAWNPVIWPFRSMWVIAFAVLTIQTFAEMLRNILILTASDENSAIGGQA